MKLDFSDLLFGATALSYLAASALFIAFLVGWPSGRPQSLGVALARWAPRLVALAVPLHAAHIVLSSLVLHVCPVEGMHFAMSIVSMLAALAYVVARRRFRVDVVGAFVAPLALTFLLASRVVGAGGPPKLRSAVLPFHVAANLLGVALFTLAFAAAVAYLVQERHLKRKDLHGIFERLPPLEALDRAEHRFLVAGFPLLTIGVLTGTLWAREVEAGGAAEIARAAFGYVSWALFGAVLLLRAAAGWRGRRAAYGTIAGFGFTVLVLALYVVRDAMTAQAVAAAGALP
ncbi:MAG TPA: cytochrome c biogenesis protein CcsA [Polyangiaceae bacterium]|nr:cytochrome c biogenesis protein CcsA [Polyangiaceae bacterium]